MAKFKIGDKVEILDGSKIKNYTGNFTLPMKNYIGKTMKIAEINTRYEGRTAYCMTETGYMWDERGLKLATDNNKKIIITSNGKTTTAKLYDGKNIIKIAKAKCSPEDEFDFNTGALIAFGRLTDSELKFEEGLDWKAFKAGKIAVKVTKDNFKSFITEAKNHGLKFKNNEDFNPFECDVDFLVRFMSAMMNDKLDVKDNEIYIMHKDNSLRISHFLGDREEFIWD